MNSSIRGMAEWLRVIDLESLAPHHCSFQSGQ